MILQTIQKKIAHRLLLISTLLFLSLSVMADYNANKNNTQNIHTSNIQTEKTQTGKSGTEITESADKVSANQSTISLPELSTENKQQKKSLAPDLWGIALTYRSANIPYETDQTTVSDVVPLLFYVQGRFFWRGLEAGYIFADYQHWNLSFIGRQRFFDIPAEFQNNIRGAGSDVGLRYRYKIAQGLNTDIEIMDDLSSRRYANFNINYNIDSGNWDFLPYTTLRFKSSEFNNYYYGLDIDSPGFDIDLTVGGTVRYHIVSDFYLLGRAAFTQFGSRTSSISTLSSDNQTELFLGIAFFEDKNKAHSKYLNSKPYVRVASGTASPSSIGEIIKFQKESDTDNNKMTSIFYGIPLSDTLFGLNIPIYFTPGYVLHSKSEVQKSAFSEYVVAIKTFYTVKWPIKWRFGFAEGLSYATKITYIEQTEMDKNNYRASKLLNFLDVSVDVDLGDLFNSKTLNNLWAGYSIHHRSGVFETSSAFGRIKGGSNYTSFYLQYHW